MKRLSKASSPGWPVRFLKSLIKKEYLEEIEGDLEERFQDNADRYNHIKARRLYVVDAFKILRPTLLRNRVWDFHLNDYAMIPNHIKFSLRLFTRNKVPTFLSIIGLAIGFFCFVIVSLFLQKEFSFDKHIQQGEHVYRINFNWLSNVDGELVEMAFSNPSLPEVLRNDYPEIKAATGLIKLPNGTIVEAGTKTFKESNLFETDDDFLEVFLPEVVQGKLSDVMEPNALVLTERLAFKYFEDNPIGQSVRIDNREYIVEAVIKDQPSTSSVLFEGLIFTFEEISADWCYTFIRGHENLKIDDLEVKLNGMLEEEFGTFFNEINISGNYQLEKLHEIHLSEERFFDFKKGDKLMLSILLTVSVIVLLLSIINYLNLYLSQASTRQVELGIRKVFGASMINEVLQYSIEFLLICLISLAVATSAVVSVILFTSVGKLLGASFSLGVVTQLIFLVALVLLILTLFSVGYIYLQRGLSLTETLKGNSQYYDNKRFRQILLGFQFAASVSLIFVTISIEKQVDFMSNSVKDLALNQVLVLEIPKYETKSDGFLNQVKQLSNVESSSIIKSGSLPTSSPEFGVFSTSTDAGKKISTYPLYFVDANFFDVLGIPLVTGRKFNSYDDDKIYDSPIINESFATQNKWTDPLSQSIQIFDAESPGEGEVIGMVPDFPFQGFREQNKPLLFYFKERNYGFLLLRLFSTDAGSIDEIKGLWKSNMTTGFEYRFLDSYYYDALMNEQNLRLMLNAFSIMALIIASIGLFGLITLNINNQKRSIAVRKVIGATSKELIFSTWKQYIIVFALTSILAYPLGQLLIDHWLKSYADKVDVSILEYLYALFVVSLIALLIMFMQSLKISRLEIIKLLKGD